jgi:hypothetical protein
LGFVPATTPRLAQPWYKIQRQALRSQTIPGCLSRSVRSNTSTVGPYSILARDVGRELMSPLTLTPKHSTFTLTTGPPRNGTELPGLAMRVTRTFSSRPRACCQAERARRTAGRLSKHVTGPVSAACRSAFAPHRADFRYLARRAERDFVTTSCLVNSVESRSECTRIPI